MSDTFTPNFGMSVDQSSKKDDISATSVNYDDMAISGSWVLIDALCGGTRAMRNAKTKYLPKQEAESQKAYDNRLNRSFLLESFVDTVDKLSGKPFVKPVTIQGDVPEKLENIKDNVDKTGRDINQLAREMLDDAIKKGKTHLLVDFTRIENPENTSIADEKAIGARPVFVHIKAKDLIFWRSDNNQELTEIRYRVNVIVPDGKYKDKTVQRIRVVTKTTWEEWEKKKTDDNKEESWQKVLEGKHTFGAVPLITFYTDQTGLLTAEPPMLKLAWLNLSHWQSSSDQKNLLNVARVPILFAKGFTEEEVEAGVTVSTKNLISTHNAEGDLKYVEHSGKALGAGREDLQDTENQMVVVGAEPLVQRPGDITATEVAVGESRSQSSLQAWIRGLESALTQAFGFAAKWLKLTLPEDFKIDIFNDFGITIKAKDDIDALLKMRQSGEISQETFLREVKRRGLLSESLDIDEEKARIEEEGPALGLIGDPDDDEEEEDPDEEETDEQ